MSRAMCGLAVLAIILCGAAASPALHAQTALHKEKMGDLGWVDPYSNARIGPEGQWGWFRDLLDDAKWDYSNPTCLQHEQDMEEFIGPSEDKGTRMYWARDRTKRRQGQTISVSYGGQTEWFVVFQRGTYSDDDMLNLLLHEGWHRIHEETDEGTAAKAAENCAWIPLEEEDDECAAADGLAADCNGGETPEEPTTPTCTDQQVWVTWTEWERMEEGTGVWEAVSAPPWNGEEGDPDDSEPVVYYVEKTRVYYRPVTRGEFQTVRVCS